MADFVGCEWNVEVIRCEGLYERHESMGTRIAATGASRAEILEKILYVYKRGDAYS
jgi:hypothetical protein